jgi:hypothetical protein
VTTVARKQDTLDVSRELTVHGQPSARVLVFPADVRDVKKAEKAVATTVAPTSWSRPGQLNNLVAN